MLHLNLLPKSKQKMLADVCLFACVRHIVVGVTVFFIIVSGWTSVFQIFLERALRDVDSLITGAKTENEDLYRSVENVNASLKAIREIQSGFTPAHVFVEDVFTRVPRNVTLETLSVQFADGTFRILGHADTRDAFISFVALLEQMEQIERIESPLENILTRDDVDFRLQGILAVRSTQ